MGAGKAFISRFVTIEGVVVGANLCERVSDFGFYVGDDLGSRVRDLDSKIACHGYALALINGGIVHSRDAVPPGSAIVYSDRPDLVREVNHSAQVGFSKENRYVQ